ncbi:uncharacterized protein LOC131615168 [Vicia villosa]|uniref:uncharacterized protein LOC131615168 n=1 Tax=Vicia villosa TaxID=3911 RepID=UPI00273AEFD5|nr:uncharacterized protein LOC131615168 [Vicia villosa]
MTNTKPSSKLDGDGDGVEEANGFEKYQETELFEDTLVICSPFTENEVEMLNLNDTEMVEDSEPEDLTIDAKCEYETEVVLDSEDEEMNNAGNVDEKSPAVSNFSVLFKKRLTKIPCEQANSKSNAATSGKSGTGGERASTNADSFNDNNHRFHSPEPEDSTLAALGFVDQYLSSLDMSLFQGVQNGKITREKSPHVSSARGSLSLAKKLNARTQNEDKDPFTWAESNQIKKEADTCSKKVEASFNFGRHGLAYKRRVQKKGSHSQNQGKYSAGNRCDENLAREPRMAADNNNFLKKLDIESFASRENVDIDSNVARTEDDYEIGLDTQIAAEAMDALANLSPADFHFRDAHQSENVPDASLSDLKQARQKSSPFKENPGSQPFALKFYKRNVSACRFRKVTYNSSFKHNNDQEEGIIRHRRNRNCLAAAYPGKIDDVKEKRLTLFTSSYGVAKKSSLNHQVEVSPHLSATSSFSKTDSWAYPKGPRGKRKRANAPRVLCNNDKENNVYSTTSLENRDDLKKKHINLSSCSYGVARKSSLNHQVEVSPKLSATSSFSNIDSWSYPKGSRGKRKRANAPSGACIDDKENNVYSTKSLEGRDDVQKSCLPSVSAGDAIKFENLRDTQPLLLAHVEVSSNKCVVLSSSEVSASVAPSEGIQVSNANHTCNEHRKKACEKILPKSSLLKELVRLGVPKSTSEIMSKDPRHRRDMTNVRVLLSQHLDDSILKQQQKILARLNISTASSSMEATHFIADKFTRTKNMLETMALGNLVLTHLWLESCGQANCFIDEKNYILRDMKKEKEIGFSMPVSLARARQKPLLKDKRVYVTPHVKPNKEVVASLVTAVHGQLVDEDQIFADKNDNILDDLLILSCEEDFAICRHFLERGASAYSSELVLNGIVIQKLELERHKLFVNQVPNNKLGKCNWFGKVYRRGLRPLSSE